MMKQMERKRKKMKRLPLVAVSLSAAVVAHAGLPPAPSLAVPPILEEAKVWLDAWDDTTFLLDENSLVTNWLSKADCACGAATYHGAVRGSVGVTNGVPAFLMGEAGSGIDLAFAKIGNIRTVFWVMDIVSGVCNQAPFLADSTHTGGDFRRQDDAIFHWDSKAFAARFWMGDERRFTWDSRRWSAADIPQGLEVYSLSSDQDLAADRLSAPKGNGIGTAGGGRALSELIIFDRTLSNGEILQVKSYLNAKWKGFTPVTVNETVTPDEVVGYGALTLGEAAAFVLTDAVLGGSKAAPISVWGAFDKSAAGKIRLTYAGHVWNRRQALFHVGGGGLALSDFELTGFPADAEISCDGRTLWMDGLAVRGVDPSPVVLDRTGDGPRLWLDAAKAESFVTNSTGGVLSWRDQSASGNDATNYPVNGVWTYPTVALTNGVPALLMGGPGSGMDLAFNYRDDIRTVFWVMDIDSNSLQASFLGTYTNGWERLSDESPDYLDSSRQAYLRSFNYYNGNGKYGFFKFTSPSQVMEGGVWEDGAVPPNAMAVESMPWRWIGPSQGLHVYSHRVANGVPAWANNLGRCGAGNAYSGGKALSELIVFNRSLTDAERQSIERSLLAKWRLASPTTVVSPQTLDEPAEYAALTVARASSEYQKTTFGGFVLTAKSLSSDRPAIRVYGELALGDGLGMLEVGWQGGEIGAGTYTILTCANRFNCEPEDFRFTGFPSNVRFFWEGMTLKMTAFGAIKPLVPSVLTASGEAAPWLWLDASDAATFTTNEQGGVLSWADRGARGNDAKAYQIGDRQMYGTVGVTNGVSAYLMGNCGSGIDLAFARTTSSRTMFWVMDIEMTRGAETGLYADFLGDEAALHFRRGENGQYCGFGADSAGWKSGVIREDGGIPHDLKTNPAYENWRLKPYAPGSAHIYSLQAGTDMAASCLSAELGCSPASEALKRNGGRALSELVIFSHSLTTAEVAEVEAYLAVKWFGTTAEVSSAVDATQGVSYPNLTCGRGASFVVKARRVKDSDVAAVTAHGILSRSGDAKITIRNVSRRPHAGTVLLRCAESCGIDLASFEFVGFPEGTTFAWEGNELRVADCPTKGLVLIWR